MLVVLTCVYVYNTEWEINVVRCITRIFFNLLRNKQLKISTIVKLTELKRPALWLHPEKYTSLDYTGSHVGSPTVQGHFCLSVYKTETRINSGAIIWKLAISPTVEVNISLNTMSRQDKSYGTRSHIHFNPHASEISYLWLVHQNLLATSACNSIISLRL